MAITVDDLRRRRAAIRRLVSRYGGANPRVFGSVARGVADDRSDVDLLIELSTPRPRGFRYYGVIGDLQEDLSKLLDTPVHVTEVRDPRSPVGSRILNEAIPI